MNRFVNGERSNVWSGTTLLLLLIFQLSFTVIFVTDTCHMTGKYSHPCVSSDAAGRCFFTASVVFADHTACPNDLSEIGRN